jgi:CelD/BcsL family acetyltransferase involved in cellulose biosynthesis
MTGELDLAQWLDFDRAHPAPTFFARPAWALALADATPHLRPAPLFADVDGERYVLPTVRTQSRMRFRDHVAFPMGGYTCVLDAYGKPAAADIAQRVVAQLARKVDRLSIVPWPLAPAPRGGRCDGQFETAVIDCADGYDRAIAGVRGVTRRMAGQAQRRGVVCTRAEAGDLGSYYDILHEASLRWGRTEPSISRRLLEAVFARGGDDAQLWFARAGEEIAAGGVILYGSEELFFWSAAMRREHANLRPSNALNFALIAQACERGVRWYNLGASEGLEGVARFKSDLGAVGIDYAQTTYQRTAFTWYERARSLTLASRSA